MSAHKGWCTVLDPSNANLGSHEEESACQPLIGWRTVFDSSSAKIHNFCDTSKEIYEIVNNETARPSY